MYTRVSTLQGPAEEIDRGVETAEREILPAIRQLEGFKGLYFLADRESGKTVAITLWESAEAIRASREAANRMREQAAEAESSTIQSVEEFEVLLEERS